MVSVLDTDADADTLFSIGVGATCRDLNFVGFRKLRNGVFCEKGKEKTY